MKMKLTDITIDYDIQLKSRGIDDDIVGGYVEAMTNGDNFPPVIVFQENGYNWLADGFHRINAAKFLGFAEIEADIKPGSKNDAAIYAAEANVINGRPMSREEKKEAGLRLLELIKPKNYSEVARRLKVSAETVRQWDYVKNNTNSKKLENEKEITNNPILIIGRAENLDKIEDETIDLIITSPPYNLGSNAWDMGGENRQSREMGVGYSLHSDITPEQQYQDWQIAVFNELYRVAKPGASFFYNHKVRQKDGEMIHPLSWLFCNDNPWLIRQEIIWDRKSTHNHEKRLFWQHDERIYWMTKDRPILPDHPIGRSTIWSEFGPRPNQSWHPAPFTDELPRMIFEAIGREGITVLDPFAGSCTTIRVALEFGYKAIGVDISGEYITRAIKENSW